MPIAMLPRSTDLPPPDERLVMPESGFEVVAGEVVAVSPAHEPHGNQHAKLSGGVRRVFAIDVERGRALEWSSAADGWQILGPDAVIEDVALEPAPAVRDLVSAGKSADAVARALLAKRNVVLERALEASHAEGRAASIVAVLVARGLSPTPDERGRILATRGVADLHTRIRQLLDPK